MPDVTLKIGGQRYDVTSALLDGEVRIEGVESAFESQPIVSDVFRRMLQDRAYDVSELGLGFYLRTLDLPEPPVIALPVFPVRHFRHSAIFVNTASGIERPEDLAGKAVGELAMYGHDAGIWPKGILSDECGLKPEQSRWVIGGADKPFPPFDFVPQIYPPGVEITRAPEGRALGPMLESGEIDALISAITPQCVLDGSPRVGRLFPDYERREREYFVRTGVFPIMHTVVVRRDLAAERPDLVRAVYQAYCAAKDAAAERYRHDRAGQQAVSMIPWLDQLVEENHQLLPEDWWPYGVAANRHTLDAFLRYHFEQGLSKRLMTCEEVFVPELLDT